MIELVVEFAHRVSGPGHHGPVPLVVSSEVYMESLNKRRLRHFTEDKNVAEKNVYIYGRWHDKETTDCTRTERRRG